VDALVGCGGYPHVGYFAGLGAQDVQIVSDALAAVELADFRDRPLETLSGGERRRVALAAALFSEPEILLLDEPTNHLDLEAALWLEGFLATYPHTIVIVSHDRDLLNRAVTDILHLDEQKLTLYPGGYDTFEERRRMKQRHQVLLANRQSAERERIQSFVDRFRYKASKARQAQSRLKMLARMEPVAAMMENRAPRFPFAEPAKLSPPVVHMDGAEVGYEPGKPVLRRLGLRIDEDDRIGLLGAHGHGQSTLSQLIARPPAGGAGGSAAVVEAEDRLLRAAPDRGPFAGPFRPGAHARRASA